MGAVEGGMKGAYDESSPPSHAGKQGGNSAAGRAQVWAIESAGVEPTHLPLSLSVVSATVSCSALQYSSPDTSTHTSDAKGAKPPGVIYACPDYTFSACFSICPFIYPSVRPSIHPSINPSLHPSIQLSYTWSGLFMPGPVLGSV